LHSYSRNYLWLVSRPGRFIRRKWEAKKGKVVPKLKGVPLQEEDLGRGGIPPCTRIPGTTCG